MKIAVAGGLQIASTGSPIQQILAANPVRTVALLGADSAGIRAELLVAEGDRVAAGASLWRDRKRPDLHFTAPAAGTVAAIHIGEKRRLTSLSIAVDGNERRRFDVPTHPDRQRMQSLLLASGLWPGFIARPFGRIPDPGSAADAIFVTTLDTQPLAADARVVLAGSEEDFARGVSCLKHLIDGPVFVCQDPGAPLVQTDEQVRCVEVDGVHPAGLAGTHINRLFPLSGQRTVWQINYQDVMAIGALLRTGEIAGERVIALAGPGVRMPRLVRVAPGADLDDLVQGEMTEGPHEVVSGSLLDGRPSRYLHRHHWQVTVVPRPPAPAQPGWLARRVGRPKPPSIVSTAAIERALVLDLPLVPLLRALSVGDTETAARLGCRELLEEDLALVTYAAGATQDFGALLRTTLDALETAA